MSLKVLLVSHFYPAHGGGIEMVAEQLARRMRSDAGAQVVWFASDTDNPPERLACEPMRSLNFVERLTGFPYPLWTPAALCRLARGVRDADAVHVHDGIYMGSIAAAILAKRHGKRLVVTQHIAAVPLPFPLRWALALANRFAARVVLARADAVAFISPAVLHYFESVVGRRSSFHYVANGVDGDVFHPDGEPVAKARKRLGFDADRPLLLFVGRFVPKKRLDVVHAIARAQPDWQWCVIGQGPEQPARWQLPNVSVHAPMPQRELADYYRAADLLVLPSQGEGFPLVVQEAMACGLPACITASVAAGSTVPQDLLLTLPDAEGETVRFGIAAIAQWLARPDANRRAVRLACSAFASGSWSWGAAAAAHADWMR